MLFVFQIAFQPKDGIVRALGSTSNGSLELKLGAAVSRCCISLLEATVRHRLFSCSKAFKVSCSRRVLENAFNALWLVPVRRLTPHCGYWNVTKWTGSGLSGSFARLWQLSGPPLDKNPCSGVTLWSFRH